MGPCGDGRAQATAAGVCAGMQQGGSLLSYCSPWVGDPRQASALAA